MYSEYEEVQRFLDDEADSYISTEEILSEYGLTYEEALKSSEEFCERFFSTLTEKGFERHNISRLCAELSELLKHDRSDEAIFLYTSMLTESGLLFGETTDNEQKILLWLEQSENADYLTELIKSEPILRTKIQEVASSIFSNNTAEIDREEQALLYRMALQNTFLYKAKNSNIFLENIGELVRQVNSDPMLKSVKPYVYSAVLSRKHKMMTGRKNYSPNIASVFERTEYKIESDNGKNFDTYQSYLELYEQLRRHYIDEIDIELTDYCFANLSNLSKWYYANCEPNEDIPMSLRQTAESLAATIYLSLDYDDLSDFIEDNPVLEIVYHNLLTDEDKWSDFISAVRNDEDISQYVRRLYEMAGAEKICMDREKALRYAEMCLLQFMEEINRRILIESINNFM